MVNVSVDLKRGADWRKIGNPGNNLVQLRSGIVLLKVQSAQPTSEDGAITLGQNEPAFGGNYDQPIWGKAASFATRGARLNVMTPVVGARAVLTPKAASVPEASVRFGEVIMALPDYTTDEAPRYIAGATWATIGPDGSIVRGNGDVPRGSAMTLDVVQPARDGVTENAVTTTMTFNNVAAKPLGALLSRAGTLTVGKALEFRVDGKLDGSTLTLSGPGADGLGVAEGNLVFGKPTTAGAINVTETLEGAPGSPRTTNGVAQVVAAAAVIALSRAADGSVGTLYTASSAGQWVTRTNAGAVADISGQGGTTYTAQAGDTGRTIGIRNSAGVVTWAAGPVMRAALLLDAMDTTAGHSVLGSGTVLTARADRKVQGAAALQVDGLAATNLAGVDFTGTDAIDPATLEVIAFNSDRLTEGVITGNQAFVHVGTPNGNIVVQNDLLQLSGPRFSAFNSNRIAGIQGQPAAAVRTRVGMLKGTTTAASTIYDAMIARAGGRPTVLLSFDDGYKTQRNVGHGELAIRGFKGTFFPAPTLIQSGGTGEFEWMTPADLRFLSDYGHDVGCDGTMDDTAMSATPADAVAGLNAVRAWIETNVGTRASRFFCYPFGNHQSDAVAQALMDAGYLVGRGTQLPGVAHTRFGVPNAYRKKLPSTGIAKSSSASTLLAKVDEAIQDGVTASFHMHSFSEDVGNNGNAVLVPASVYQPFLDGLAQRRDAGLVDVLTYSEWWARDGGAGLPV